MSSSKKTLKDPFQIENMREEYAFLRDRAGFLRLYTNSIPLIKNRNSEALWDEMLSEEHVHVSPMTADRIEKTAYLAKKYISTLKKDKKQISIFDLGIGNAFVEKKLISICREELYFTGLDNTQKNLKILSKTFSHFRSIKDTFENFANIKFSEKFDLVFALEVLEHINPNKIFKTLGKINSLLEEKGALIVSVPIHENLKEKIFKKTNYSAHVRRYTPDIIKYELEIAGFKILEEKYLYAFSKLYALKTLTSKIFKLRKPNLVIILATKQ